MILHLRTGLLFERLAASEGHPISANLFRMFFVNIPQSRHPERSASQIYRLTQRCGAESKDPEGAYLTHAARSFSTTEASTGRTRHGLSMEPGTRTATSCYVRRLHLHPRQPYRHATPRTINSEFKDLARAWGDVPLNMQILFSGFVGSKAPNSMGKISTLGVLRLRAQALCSRDKSVRRSAQDDDFVGVLKITSKAS
jgi:hypothetical protein